MYGVTELVAVGLAWQLLGIARAGDDLAQAGMTAYMFDVVYLTWFVHVGTALVSARLAATKRRPAPCSAHAQAGSRCGSDGCAHARIA